MTPEQIRIEALRLAIVDDKISNPDTRLILDRARQYEAFIVGSDAPRTKRTSRRDPELPMGAAAQE